MGKIVGEAFRKYVSDQLQIRQETAGAGFGSTRSTEQLQIQNNRNAWLKLASSVRVQTVEEILKELKKQTPNITKEILEESERTTGVSRLKAIGFSKPESFLGNKLALNSVLFNTLSSLTLASKENNTDTPSSYKFRSGVSTTGKNWNDSSSYGLGGGGQGISPSPGLISAKVDCLNRGSIRKATVEIKCFDKFQFELIEILYIRLGYTMLLEWGWDKFINNNNNLQQMGNTLTEDIWFKEDNKYNFTKLNKAVERYRQLYSGNYDGFIGKVSNFDWTFEQDGTYSITLHLISVGDIIESLKVNLPQQVKTQEDLKAIVNGYNSGLQNFPTSLESNVVNNAGSSPLAYDLFTDIMDPKGKNKWWGYGEYLNLYWRLKNDDSSGGLLENIKALNDGEGVDIDRFGYYLTLGELLRKIKTFCIPKQSGESMLLMDTDEDTNIMAVYPNQISFDPKVALVKPSFASNIALNNYNEFSTKKTGVKQYWDWMKAMKDWVITDKENPNVFYGKIMNIYLNYDFVSSLLEKSTENSGDDKGDIYLYKFLQNICNGINSALGDIPNLEPILTDDNIITIQDQNKIRGIENSSFKGQFSDKVQFELFGYDLSKNETAASKNKSNIVQDFSFKTKMDKNLSSMISIGATANGTSTKNYDATAFSNWNAGLRDQYQFEIKDPKTVDDSKGDFDVNENRYRPLTLAKIQQLKKHFDESATDTHWGIFRRSNVDSTRFGITFDVHKDVEASPLTGKNYSNTTWSEYVNDVIEDIEDKGEPPTPKELQKFSDNYVRYLIQAFRGKANGSEDYNGYYYQLNGEFVKQGKQSFKGYVNILDNKLYNATGTPSTKIGFIPANLGLTCDGISGVRIYNSLKIRQEFLPSQYPKALEFVISKVNHEIGDNTWSTKLETISTPKTKDENLGDFTRTAVEETTNEQVDNIVIIEGDAPRVSITTSIPLDNNNLSAKWKEKCKKLVYVPESTGKNQIVLHHTGGTTNARGDIRNTWAIEPYPLCTHYHLQRDGFLEHIFPLEYWSKHLASTPGSDALNKISVGIEIVSLGHLEQTSRGWKAWTGDIIPDADTAEPYYVNDNNEIVRCQNGYRNVYRFQKYTSEQISVLKDLIIMLKDKFAIPVYLNKDNYKSLFPPKNKKDFGGAMDGKPGIYTHNSYRTDKLDVLPQKEVLQMLMEIGNS